MAGFYPGTKPRAWSILHIINVIIAIVAMIVTAYRLIAIMDMRITSRADIIALGAVSASSANSGCQYTDIL